MTDRELLELAAKAAGYDVVRASDDGSGLLLSGVQEPWNPLADDGDCARLEAALGIDVAWRQMGVMASHRISEGNDGFLWCDIVFRVPYADHGGDKQRARRAAVLLAAAEIGRAMP